MSGVDIIEVHAAFKTREGDVVFNTFQEEFTSKLNEQQRIDTIIGKARATTNYEHIEILKMKKVGKRPKTYKTDTLDVGDLLCRNPEAVFMRNPISHWGWSRAE